MTLDSRVWARVGAWSAIARDADKERFLLAYRGDLVHDGAILAASEGPFVAVLRDLGTHMCQSAEAAETTRQVFGAEGERSLWFYGEGFTDDWGQYRFSFTAMPAAEAIARLKDHEAALAAAEQAFIQTLVTIGQKACLAVLPQRQTI